jgi:putative tricarboxylic transport membrane protein
MNLSAVFDAFARVLSPQTALYGAAAMLLGILFGAMPGLTAALGVALLTGLTFSLSTEHMLVILLCIYVGAIYGGSISAVLTNIPGTGAAIATAWEGYPLAQRGEAGQVIGMAATASLAGTLLGLVALAIATPLLGRLALSIGSPEITLLALLGVLLVGLVSGPGTALKGWMAGMVGLLVSTIGLDAITASPRFTFGSESLTGGVPFIPAMIGLFGVAQIVETLGQRHAGRVHSLPRVLPRFRSFLRHLPTTARSGLIGIGIGITPGVGENIASLLSYSVARRGSKEPELYGRGSYEGLIASETANNACVPAAIIPLITLGIPGSPVTAIVLGALLLHGVQPGPLLLTEHPGFLAELIAIFSLASLLLFVMALLLARPISLVLHIPPAILLPVVTTICVIGAYSLNLSHFDIGVMVVFGALGLLLRAGGFPAAPLVMGLILGPFVETNLRRTFMISDGSLMPFVERPISLVLVVVSVAAIFSQTALWRRFRARRGRSCPSRE